MKIRGLLRLLYRWFTSKQASVLKSSSSAKNHLSYIVTSYSIEGKVDPNTSQRFKPFGTDAVDGLTLGFRKTLSKVFSSIYELPGVTGLVQILENKKIQVHRTFVLESSASMLNETQPYDFLVVYVVQSKTPQEDILDAFHRYLLRGHSEQDIVQQLETKFLNRKIEHLVSLEKRGFPGIKVFTPPSGQVEERTVSLLCGFYYYGWLIATRLERGQADVNISNEYKTPTEELREVIDHRITLINLDRYFLTMNRSNSPEIRKVCDFLLSKLRIVKRYKRHEKIHRAFETHLANLSNRAQTNRARNVKRVVEILTFLVVPLGVFTAVMSIRLDNPLIAKPGALTDSVRFWKITAVSLLVPVLFIAVAALIDAGRRFWRWLSQESYSSEFPWW